MTKLYKLGTLLVAANLLIGSSAAIAGEIKGPPPPTNQRQLALLLLRPQRHARRSRPAGRPRFRSRRTGPVLRLFHGAGRTVRSRRSRPARRLRLSWRRLQSAADWRQALGLSAGRGEPAPAPSALTAGEGQLSASSTGAAFAGGRLADPCRRGARARLLVSPRFPASHI